MTEDHETTPVDDSETERRMHRALKSAWVYVNRPFASESVKRKVRHFAEVDAVTGHRVAMMFALQAAWPFVHESGNPELVAEVGNLLRHGMEENEIGWSAGGFSPEGRC